MTGGLNMNSQSITKVNQLNGRTVSTLFTEHDANKAKVSADGSIDTHSNVVITTPANGQLLTYNGTNLVNSTGALSFLALSGGTMTGDVKYGASAFTLYTAPQAMTAKNSGGFIASASDEYNPAYYAFNASQNDHWTTAIYYNDTTGVYTRTPATTNTWGGIGYTGEYIKIDLGAIYRIKNYYVRSSSANFIETTPSIWYVETSADNITYTLWDSRSGEAWTSQSTKTYTPASNASARYIIFVMNKTGSGGTSLRSQPRMASLYFDYETFNYDITNVRNMTGYTSTTSGAIRASGLITASAGLTGTTLTASGLITANAGVDMKSQIMSNLATPSASTDGANKTYVDTLDGQNVKLTGTQTMSGTKKFSGILATSLGVPCIIGRNTKGTAATGGLELYGNNMNGPCIQAFVNTSVYPTFQLLNWGQDNTNLYFDCYYNGTSILSSNTSSNFQIAKYANKLSFNYKNGGTLGQAITMSEVMNISTAGLISVNAGISVVNSTVDIRGEARSGSHATPVGLYATANLGQSSGGIEFRHSNGTQGVGFGYNSVYAAGSNTNQDLNFYSKGSGIIYFQSAMTCSSSLTVNSGISTTTLTASSSITLNTTGSGGSIISGSRQANTTEPLIVLKANAGGNNRGAIGWSGTQLYAWSTPNPNGDVGSAYNYVPQNSAWGFSSDRRLKSDIKTLECSDCCEKLMKLNCCSYYWKSDEKKEKKNCGFIADEVKKIFPEFVDTTDLKIGEDENLEGITYTSFIPILVSAFQHMAEKLVNLEKENKTLLNILQDQANQLAEIRAVVFPPNAP